MEVEFFVMHFISCYYLSMIGIYTSVHYPINGETEWQVCRCVCVCVYIYIYTVLPT